MGDINTSRRPAELLADLGAEKLANLIVNMAMPAATEIEWDSETIELVLSPMERTFEQLGIPGVGSAEDRDALRYWVIENQRRTDPNWVPIEASIDLGQRNNETGYIDSIKLICTVLVEHGGLTKEAKSTVTQKVSSDIIEIEDSGYDLETCADLLAEWEELAEEYDLRAYADGESGMYWVTNIPEED